MLIYNWDEFMTAEFALTSFSLRCQGWILNPNSDYTIQTANLDP